MEKEKYDVFISYSRRDAVLAKHIQESMESVGLHCFRDTDIAPGPDFIDVLCKRITDSKFFLLIGSSNAYQSDYTKREIIFAEKKRKQIIPFLIDDSKLPDDLDFLLGNLNIRSINDYPVHRLADEIKDLAKVVPPKPFKNKEIIVSEMTFQRCKPVEFIISGIRFNMLPVKSGIFTMGTDDKGNGYPAHQVELLKDYYIGETLVTQALWKVVMGNNPSHFQGDDRPVEMVSWYDCKCFLHRLAKLTNHHFRFPTEAEWEYAARGRRSDSDLYSGSSEVWNVAWYCQNNGNGTSPVKQKMKNSLGIYDMSGNVNEWCQDFYTDYSNRKITDPTGPKSGKYRILRGGSWYENEIKCRVYIRNKALPDTRGSNLGLRLALSYDS